MTGERIILASRSPRRIKILKDHGIEAEVIPSERDERLPFRMTPADAAMYLSLVKAADVSERNEDACVIASDTVVSVSGEILGKPEDEEDGFRMLSMLRGRVHQVISGLCIISPAEDLKICAYDRTDVKVADITDGQLREYLATPEPYDKAGAYAIQGAFGKYIIGTEGSVLNVIGFPWEKFAKIMSGTRVIPD
ncbi:MAG: Maf family protein [Anaerovoracaceae bacterium]|jgi:septum formation protein